VFGLPKKYYGESDSEGASNSWLTSKGDSSQLIVSNPLGSSSPFIRLLSFFEVLTSSSEDYKFFFPRKGFFYNPLVDLFVNLGLAQGSVFRLMGLEV
jgi:hypothetical protein